MLSVRSISKSFGGNRVLNSVGFEVESGQVVGLIGPNGSGKTTLFDIITGHKAPDEGEVLFRGEPITGLRPEHICHLGIARTFQIIRIFGEFTALENVALGGLFGRKRRLGRGEAEGRAEELLGFVGLEGKRDSRASELTLTEQRRLELAMALATEPSLLLLDEVAAGLSPKASELAMDLMGRLRTRGLTLLVVDHVLKPLMAIADRIVVVAGGSKVTEGAPGEVAEDERVIEAYLGEKYVF